MTPSHLRLYPAIALAVLLAACATTPERSEPLEQARSEVERLGADPMAAQNASRELAEAREWLRRAETAFGEREPQERVAHLAYMAERKAEIGLSTIAEARARERIARAEAERNRVLLESREREARTAQSRAQRAVQAARSEAEQARAARAELEQLRQSFAELQAQQTERGMVLTLGDVLFEFDRAELKPGAARTMDRLAEFLRENPEMRVLVEGHTDSVGAPEYNEALSRRRAEAVANALANRGIGADRYEIMGRGENYPVASNDTNAGRQQNRRVEIVFSDLNGDFTRSARRPRM